MPGEQRSPSPWLVVVLALLLVACVAGCPLIPYTPQPPPPRSPPVYP